MDPIQTYFSNAAEVTPSDTVDLPALPRVLYIGGAGTLRLRVAGLTVNFTVTAGTVLPVRASRVFATGTTATGIVSLF